MKASFKLLILLFLFVTGLSNANALVTNFTVTAQSPLCPGDTGRAFTTIISSTSTGPYEVRWFRGTPPFSQIAVGDTVQLPAGSFFARIFDFSDATLSGPQFFTITNPNAIVLIPSQDPTTCFGGADGRAILDVFGGTLPFSYVWDDPLGQNGTTFFSDTISGLTAGVYRVTVTDNNGCTAVDSTTVTEPTQVTPNVTTSITLCVGSSDGSATATPSGGSGTYTAYAWDSNPSTTAIATGYPAGTYTVTVTDSEGCTNTETFVIGSPVPITASFNTTPNLCFGDNNGAIVTNPSGGTSPYTYNWQDGPVTRNRNNLFAGTYTVTITDNLGCTHVDSATVSERPPLVSVLTVNANNACFGDTDGSITATISGGTSGYNFVWSNSVNGTGSATTISNLAAGTYTVTFTDAFGCTEVDSATITEPTQLQIAVNSQIDPTCFGGNDGSIGITASGGTVAVDYSYLWSAPGNPTTAAINGLFAGTYTVTVTDDNNCTATRAVTLNNPAPILPNVTTDSVTCRGGSDGSATATPTGGDNVYTYAWSVPGTTPTINGLSAGTYTVTVTDGDGCQGVETFQVGEPATAITINFNVTPILCFGQNTGSITTNVSGGNTPYTYNWFGGPTSQNRNNLFAGTYTLTVTDGLGCTQVGVANVTQRPNLNILLTKVDNVCAGGNIGSVTATISGGTSGYSYDWSNLSNGLGSVTTISNLATGTYTITVTDAFGCTKEDSISVDEPSTIDIQVNSVTDPLCNGDANGTIDLTVSGGTPALTFGWNNLATTEDLNGLSAGTYTLTVTDANGCTATFDTTLVDPAVLNIVFDSLRNISCNGANDGFLRAAPVGGTTPYTYTWSTTASTTSINNLGQGTYLLTVTDANGCTDVDSASIAEPAALAVNINGTDASCAGVNDGTANALASGGTSPYTYAWNPGGQTTALITGLGSGTFTVTVTDSRGCTATDNVVISQPNALNVSVTGSDLSCKSDGSGVALANVLGGSAPYTFLWSDPAAQTTNPASSLAAGNYTVTVTDQNGCTSSASVTLTEPDTLLANIASTDPTCNGINDGTASASPSGGTTPYTYSWAPGAQTTPNINGLAAGTYIVTVTDANNCTHIDSVTLTPPTAVNIVVDSLSNISCNGANDGYIELNPNGGNPPYTYTWNVGPSTRIRSGLSPGNYNVTVTDNSGCFNTANFNITEPAALTLNLVATDANCAGIDDGTITTTVGGGTPAYTFNWNDFNTGQNRTGLAGGTYTLTVTDDNGCTITSSVTINQATAIVPNLTTTDVSCGATNDGTATVGPTGGTPPYTFNWGPGSPTGQGTNSITGLSAGNYTITISDNNACDTVLNFTINQGAATFTISDTVNNISCNGANDGEINLGINGGTTPFTYTWNPALPNSPNQNGLANGTYNLTVTDGSGCTLTDTYTIIEPAAININSTLTDESCFPGGDGAINLVVNGGTSPYTYTWNPPLSNSPNQTGLTAGLYQVTVTDQSSCTDTASFNLTQLSNTFTIALAAQDISCNGAADGQITVTVNPTGVNYTYQWNGGLSATSNPTVASPGTYTVTVTDTTTGCLIIDSATVNEPSLILANLSVTSTGCTGLGLGNAKASPSGGNGAPYTFVWGPGNPTGQGTDSISGLAAGSYTVTITDNNSCSIIQNFTVGSSTSNINPNEVVTDASCFGDCDGAIVINPSNGVSPYFYNWADAPVTTPLRNNLCAGVYTVTITGSDNCDTVLSVTVGQPDSIFANVRVTPDTCVSGVGGARVTSTTNGTPPYTYTWPASGTAVGDSVNGLLAGNYNVTITDNSGCSQVQAFVIANDANFTVNLVATDVLCFNDRNGSIAATVIGGTSPVTYNWTGGLTGINPTGLGAGTYTLTVTDANGCGAVQSATVNQPLELTIGTITTTPESCLPGNDGTATANPAGGTLPYTYSWPPPGTGSGNTGSNYPTGNGYILTVTDANGCSNVELFDVGASAAFTVNSTVVDATCGNSDGSIAVTLTGATAPITYNWNDIGIAGPNRTNIPAATYVVTITDASTCSETATIDVITSDAIQIDNIVTTDETCNPGSDGTATTVISGGTAPFTFQWSVGTATTPGITGLTAGSYTVIVTDANGCTDASGFNIFAGSDIFGNENISNVLCNGDANGSISLSPSGGIAPYTYNWAPISATSPTVTGLTAGGYQVTITDATGCTKAESYTVTQPLRLASSFNTTTESCSPGNDGTVTANASRGTPPYTYNWGAGNTSVDNQTGLAVGSYTMTITDANACTRTFTYTISPSPAIIVNANLVQPATCGNSDGEVAVTSSGGVNPLTYTWNDLSIGGGTPNSLAAGTYTVTVTDGNGCTDVDSVTVTTNGSFPMNPTLVNPTCNGDADGSITLSPSGGTAPYTYLWGNSSTNFFRAGLIAGNYDVTVTDATGCSIFQTINLTEPDPVAVNISGIDESCVPGGDGSASTAASGGTAPYTYLWSPGGATGPSITNLSTGRYFVTVTDVNGCFSVDSVDISSGGNIALNETITNTTCNGDCDGSISLAPSGGNAPYTYLWDNNSTNSSRTNLCAGNYSVTVTDNSGCSTDATFNVTEPSPITANLTKVDPTCFPGFDGSVRANPTGGTGPYSFVWAPGGATTIGLNGLNPGNYTVTITDSRGCTASESIRLDFGTISQNGVVADVTCFGSCDGSIILSPSGGFDPNYFYQWDDNSTNFFRAGLCAGTYSVTVTNGFGCSRAETYVVGEPDSLQARISGLDESCNPGGDGSASTAAIGGTSPYTYAWAPGGQTTSGISSLTSGTYTVTVTDNNGCTVVDNVTINSGGNIDLNEILVDARCNAQCDGSITLNPSGGVAPYTYLWDNNSSNANRTALCAASYSVTVTDNSGCSTTASFTINEPDPLVTNLISTNESCSPGNDGTITSSVTGGTGPYTYQWSPGGAITPNLSSLTAGVYQVTVTDQRGCSVIDNITVGSGANINLNANVTDARCNGDCNGSVSLSPSGGSGPYTFIWSNSSTSANNNGLCAGPYDVTVTDNTGCSTTASFNVNEPAPLAANTGATDASCIPGNDGAATSAASGGTSPYTYLWSPGGATTPGLSNLAAGTYRLTITDGNGCTVVDSSVVGTGGNLALNGTINDASCNGVCDGDISLVPSGGVGPYTFNWSNTATTAAINGLCAGDYTVTVTDNSNCTRISTFTVQEPAPLLANASSTDESCTPGSDGSASTAASGGTAPYTYSWAPVAAVTPGISSLTAGSYTVTVTDRNGCSVVETVVVGSTAPFSIVNVVNDVSCNGAADGSISLTINGAVGTLTYNWSDIGIAGPNRTGLVAATYDVTITDGGNGCIDTESYLVSQPAAIGLSTTVVDASCVPGNDGSIDLTVSGGDAPYTYQWNNGAPPVEDPSNLGANVYTVTVTDGNGCTATTSATVGGGAAYTVSISTTDASCPGNNDGSAIVNVSGAVNPITYSWTGGLSGSNPTSIPVGTYTVTITDGSGCTEVRSISINDPAPITASIGSTNTTTCGLCDGEAFVFGISGGTGSIGFEWLDAAKTAIGQTTDTASGLCPGIYYAALRDANGCVDTLSVSVSDGPALPINLTSTNESCGNACDGTATVSSPCISSLDCTVEWRDASNTLIATTSTISNLCPGDYFVEVTDITTGCISNDVVTILPADPIVPNLTTGDDGCNGLTACQGFAKAEPTGGVAPYTYSWAGPSTSVTGLDSIGSLCAGNYSVTISDANGCDTVLAFTIAPRGTITPNETFTNETCDGLCDGTASVNPTGGQMPYTFTWSNNAGNVNSLSGLCSGIYTVTITDAVACDTTVTFNIGSSSLQYTLSSTDQSCNGGCDGTAEVQIPGGTSGYSFNWSPAPGSGQGSAQVTGLCVGEYFVTITLNSSGCTAVDSITIDPFSPILPNESSRNESCSNACDGIARVAPSGGNGPYTYQWTPTPPNNQQGNAEVRDLCAGTYTVQITDASGCDTSIAFTITPATQIVSNIVGEDQLCGNANPCEGKAYVSPSGGLAPYTYQWTLGVLTSAPDTAINLCAGEYFVTITDANACSIIDSITINGPSPIDTSFSAINATCNICDGSLKVTPTGGTTPYTYSWTDASANNLGTTDSIGGLCSGIYLVQISDASGCSATFARSISDRGAEAVSVSKTDVSCFNGNDGTATASFVCSDGPCRVDWLDGSAQSLGVSTPTITGLSAGTYFVEVTNNSGCKTIESITIGQPDQLFVNASITDASCNSSCDGAISLNLIGGTGNYTFTWSPSPGAGQGTSAISGLCATTYQVTISDANACDTVITYTVGSPAALTASFTSVDANCNQSDGSITASISGGTIALDYQYQWFDGSNNLLAGEIAPVISNIPAGTYVLRVRDDNSCEQRFTTVLSNTNGPTVVIDSITDVSCFGSTDGEIFITASGPSTPFTYNWLNFGQSSEDISNLAAGTYTVQVRNSAGCLTAEIAQVNEPSELLATFTNQDASCGQCNGSASVSISGGTAPYTYLWSNGSTADTTANLCGGAHSLIVRDANGCRKDFNFTINTSQGPSNAIVSTTAESCAGANDGTATVTPVGGTAPYTYLWVHNGSTSNSLSNLSKGTYFLLITDVAGCSRNVEVNIGGPTEIQIQESVVPSSCGANCDGSIGLNINGGIGPYTYSWASAPTADTNFRSGLCAGIYLVTVTDASGCSESKSIILPNSGNPIVANPTVADVSCFGSCDGSLISNLTPAANLTFQWTNDQGLAVAPPDQNLNNAACAGDYILEVTTLPSGCKSFARVSINEPDSILLASSIVKNISCAGECDGEIFISTLGGNILYSYSWDNGSDGLPLRDLCAGTYTVTATDANGCTATTSVTLNDPAELVISLNSQTDLNCSSDCDGQADVSASGGVAPYTFNWDGGQQGNNPTDLCFGPNVLSVTDATGCLRTLTVNIGAVDTVVAQVPSTTLFCNGDSINLDATILGSTVTSTAWYLEDTTTLLTNAEDTTVFRGIGTHTFFLIATNGACNDTTEYTFEVVPTPIVSLPPPINIFKDEVANITISGEDASYLYNWSPSTNLSNNSIPEPIASPKTTTSYVLTVTDTNGCQYIDSVLVIYNPNLGIPSGISPNGDGKNDVWRLDILEEFPNATVQVFNRWGELMYEQRNGYREPWDGTYKGEPLPVGTYYYVIDLNSDRFDPVTGPITIVK